MSNPSPSEIFHAEAQDLLENIEQGLLDLEGDPENQEVIGSVFRALHTLKGSGAMFGFTALAAFTHHCESAFDRVRKGVTIATPQLISAVLSALDYMRALAEGGEADPALENTLLNDIKADAPEEEAAAPKAPAPEVAKPAKAEKVEQHWKIHFALPQDALINGTRPLSLLDELRSLGKAQITANCDKLPELDKLEPRNCLLAWDVDLVGMCSKSDIEDVFIFVMDDMELSIELLTPSAAETKPAPEAAAAKAAPAAAPAAKPAETPAAAAKTPAKAKNADAGTLRIPADRLDDLMDRVAELVIAQSRLKQVAFSSEDSNLRAVSEEIERLASELRDSMMLVRMVPVAQLFGRFRRLVRDLAKETGKEISYVTEGESTELDKTVIERLADPLIHMIRNSADHGLEPPADRVAAGKDPTGEIKLSARQSGAEVIISVTDNGRGINREKVLAKGIENGLVKPDAKLTDREIYQLIFQPGFSTAEKVTDLSGRGVGMDVVKRTIDSLRGSIEVDSHPGQGSVTSLRIPLTLAIIDGLLVRVGQNRYVIPLSAVEECVELTPEQDNRSSGRNFLTLRNTLVPFVRLREIFRTGTEPDPYQKVVVVTTGKTRGGLVVDQILGQHQTVIKPMSPLHANIEIFSGATILGDGGVALILDVARLFATEQKLEEQLQAAE